MAQSKLIRQTLFLSCSHFAVRAVGFVMRIWLSRELGAQAMGLVELAQSAQMLLITPVVSGLPAAVSRMSAQRRGREQTRVLQSGVLLSLLVSLPVMALAFLLREPLALWLGDLRTLPALIVYLPCIPILGVSCAFNGYYYGTGRPVPPALSELLEQIVRFLLCVRLVSLLRGFPLTLRSAIPALASLAGETVGLVFMLLVIALAALRRGAAPAESGEPDAKGTARKRSNLGEMVSLALPLTGMKLVTSLMRTASAALIPARLQVSGLTAAESISRFGMLHGMMMPVLMLPSFITCSLSMVASPELSRRQAEGKPLGRLTRRVLLATLLIGLPAMAAVWLFAPLFAGPLYRQAELLPLLRVCCPLVPVLALCHVTGGLMNGLGLQGKSLRIALVSNFLSLLLMYALAALPGLRLWGAVLAMAAGNVLTLLLNLRVLRAQA